jgi:hypothetical protein
MARPRIEINWEDFDKLCAIQCTQVEIASWFKCSVDTIERAVKRKYKMGFAEYYAQKADTGKISLRRQQWQLALKGDRTMLIWLGKQHLGQAEKEKLEHSGPDGGPQVILNLPANGSELRKGGEGHEG